MGEGPKVPHTKKKMCSSRRSSSLRPGVFALFAAAWPLASLLATWPVACVVSAALRGGGEQWAVASTCAVRAEQRQHPGRVALEPVLYELGGRASDSGDVGDCAARPRSEYAGLCEECVGAASRD